MLRSLLSAMACCLALCPVSAQNTGAEKFCGTPEGKVQWLKEYQAHPKAPLSGPRELYYVPLSLHILGNDDGTGYFSVDKLDAALCQLNKDFEAVGMRFYQKGPIDYINNSAWNSHQSFGPGYKMMEESNFPNAINCYVVADPAGNCGYSIYGRGIALKSGCILAGSHTWAHEMGHALSLPHTFLGWEGEDYQNLEPAPNKINGVLVEKVDGSNCQDAGDGFCDTPADYLSFRWPCNNDKKSNITQTDPNGENFQSDGRYFMSYASDECMEFFSDEQRAAMVANLLDDKANMLFLDDPKTIIDNEPILAISPADSAANLPLSALFSWEPIEGAEEYTFQLSRFPSFPFFEQNITTSQPYVQIDNLIAGKNYYWRVRARNTYSFCGKFSKVFYFNTFLLSGTQDLSGADWTLSPTLVSGAQSLNFESEEPIAIAYAIHDVSGAIVQKQDTDQSLKSQRHSIAVEGLQAGLYFVQVRSGQAERTFKVVILQ